MFNGTAKTQPVVFDLVNNLDGVAVDKTTGQYNAAVWWSTKMSHERDELDFKFMVIDEMRDLTKMYRVLMDNLEKWELKFEALKQFYEENGHTRATKNMSLELKHWCCKQKKNHAIGHLSIERKEKLDSINFIWKHSPESQWNKRFEELTCYMQQNGPGAMPSKKECLGIWSHNQRNNRRNGELSEKRIKLLDSIGFEWNPKNDCWDKHYTELVEFYQQNGHSRVPWHMRVLNNWHVKSLFKKYCL